MPIPVNYTGSDLSTGRIIIDGISRGVGLNLGNALRRTLLSQLEGAAVTAVRINGALHEFDCVDGVKEDVTEIIGNLRKLDLRLDGDGGVVARIATNQREVKALDIQTDGGLEVLNPDLHIAMLNPDASLQMEIEIEKGRGFRPAKENLKSGHPENTIPVASNFSPVRRAGYSIEQIDGKTEKLIIQIKTNGSLTPQDAALQTIDLLTDWLRMDSLISHSDYNGDAGEFYLDETASHNLGSALKRELLAYEADGDRPVLAVELRSSSMNIRTDGTMNPKSALESAASGLRERFAELRKAIADCVTARDYPSDTGKSPQPPLQGGEIAFSRMQAQPIVFGDTAFAKEAPDLLAIQLDSYSKFMSEGLPSALSEAFPITDASGKSELELVGYRLGETALDADDCRLYLRTYSAPLWISLRLSVKENGSTKEGEICIGEIPLMTERGTFVINGVERVVVSQLHRSPGAFFTEETDAGGNKLYTARIVPYRGAWLELESDPEGRINARLDRRKQIHVTVLLRALGWETDEEILSLFDGMTEEETEPVRKTLEDDVIKTENDALMEILKLFYPESELDIESARSRFQRFFFDPARYDLFRVGRAMLNRKLGMDVPEDETTLKKEDVVETLKYLLKLIHGEKKPDDMEHLGNRRVRSVGELLQIQLLMGLSRMARTAKESLAVQDLENAAIQDIVHPGSLADSIREFFESSQLSHVMQQTNPLDELTHARRLSLLGPGGVHRDRAPIEVRDVHRSHLGRICPIEAPEGPSVGLILSLANHARVDKYGFLETPYRKVEKTDLVEYLTADKTDGRVIADSVKPSIAYLDSQMVEVDESEVDYVALYRQQILGTSASLIPLIEHNDPNRALMGANMQRQAVPLLHPEAPLVQTGMERKAAVDSRAVVQARGNGKVKKATSHEIAIAYADGKYETYRLVKHRRSNGGFQMNQRPVVSAGQSVHKGQIIADCQSSENGVLSLGRNILVAYMPWEGYNFEGGIVISDRLIKDDVFTSVSIQSFRVEARDTEHGVEYFTRDVPDKEKFWQLEENGIVKEGKWVKPGDVLVGKLTPMSDVRHETSDVRLETGDKSREVRYEDASQVVPPYVEGQVIRAIHLSGKRGDDLPAGVEEVAIVHVAVRREVKAGDKFTGRHGNKGVVAKIVPEEDMPFLPDGTPIQMILNPLGIPARMNLGQILETHLGWAASKLGGPVISPPYDGASNEDIKHLLQTANLPEDGMITLFDGRDGRAFDMQVTVGYQYQMKLHHQVDEKIHARASGPYSILTGQPLGGRSQFGGQRCGEMEIWALQAYGAAHTLHEMMTLKSISTAGVRTYEALAKGEEVHSTDYEGDAPSFKLLTNWMRSLCINMTKDEEGVKVRLASPEEIRGWSEGEVDVRLADGITEGDRGDEKDAVLDELPNPDVMGHIELAAPVSHIWFFKGLPSSIGLALGLAFKEIEKVIYYDAYIVLDSASDALSVGQILTPQEYEEIKGKHEFRAGIGAGAIGELLARIDFDATIREVRAQMEVTDAKEIIRKLKKRLVLIQSLQRAGLRPEWMITDVIPVVPYTVRPNIPLQVGEYATADLNTLYKRVIIHNNRLKRLVELKAPETVIHNEKRALQEAVDALFDNGRHGRVARDETDRQLISLSDLLKGKAGIFRGSLLGSRVDYSGRSVIVPGPELKLGECGLPIEMALTLFEPFVIRLMRKTGRARTIMSAVRAVRQKHPEAVETLREVIADKLVLLNRAPTLHRASVQAFRPVLVDDRAMHLHPLVCYAFNADFDGDQMAVHVPVTPEARKEARELMLSHRNILSPITGRLLARPSMDMILGCHYLTLSQDAKNTGGDAPLSCDEIKRAYELGEVGLHQEIQLNVRDEVIKTTVGRAIFNDILEGKLPFVNETLDADRIFELVEAIYREHGEEQAVALLDRLKDLGFRFATRSGISLSDLRLETGDWRLEDLDFDVPRLTSENRYRDGLSQLEYFTLTHGARMRLANTVLKLESSGYLTRKLAVVASDVVVMEEDCGTQKPRNVVNCETLYGVCSKCYGDRSAHGAIISVSIHIEGKRYYGSDPKTGPTL